MPLRNDLFGVFKIMTVKNENGVDTVVIGESGNSDRDMKSTGKTYIQGTAETRILDIGLLSETIKVEAPILIGGGSTIDGRTLLNNQITNAANKDSQLLPVLSNATINIDAQNGGNVSITMKSDGAKSEVFKISNGSVPNELDPAMGVTRVAKNWDFYVEMGNFVSYIQKASIEVNTETAETVFLDSPLTPGNQYPYLGISGISISGGGTAAVVIGGTNDPQGVTEQLTLQSKGVASSESLPFSIKIGGANGVPLFADKVDLSNAVINKTTFNATTGILTVAFKFTAWVKIA